MMPIDDHLKIIKILQAHYAEKKLYVECMPTDTGAICFPNSNMAIKEIQLPDTKLPTPPQLREGEVELPSWIDFENHKNKMTVGCPDEDSEMTVTISHNGRRSRYTLDMDEAEDLNKFLTNHIANYKLG